MDWMGLGIGGAGVLLAGWTEWRRAKQSACIERMLWRLLDRHRMLLVQVEEAMEDARPKPPTSPPTDAGGPDSATYQTSYSFAVRVHATLCVLYPQIVQLIAETTPRFGLKTIRRAVGRKTITSQWQLHQFLALLPNSTDAARDRAALEEMVPANPSERATHDGPRQA